MHQLPNIWRYFGSSTGTKPCHMFLLELTYKVSLHEVDAQMPAHADYLNAAFAKGDVVFSGPKNPRTGGLIFTRFSDKGAVDHFIHHDPFYRCHIADYRVIEFNPTLGSGIFEQ